MNKNKRFVFLSVIAAALVFAAGLHAQTSSQDLQKAMGQISGPEAYQFVKKLASPEFSGRLTGSDGYTAAAKWAAGLFSSWGLKPAGDKGGYLQAFPSPYAIVKSAELTLLLPDGKAEPGREPSYKEMKLVPEKEFLPMLYTDSGDRTAAAVFAGWGISAPEIGYDDYAGLDVKGKFIFCFRGTPDGDKKFQPYDEHRIRMKTALDKGALGVIYIYPDSVSNPNGDWQKGFTPALVTDKVMDSVLKEVNSTAADLKKALQTYKRPISFPLAAKVHLKVESEYFPDGTGYNVVGYIEGRDPKLRKECVVVGGHFDHNGTHMGLLFGGANDNASGSATVMEAARAFAALKIRPRRSVIFILFGGEEKGLQGSAYYADHPSVLFDRIAGMINFDMTGEGDHIGGAVLATAEDLRKCIEDADKTVRTIQFLGSIPEGTHGGGSDYASFIDKGIPAATFGSNGPHLYYHQTGDTIYRLNPDIMAQAARLAFLSAYYRADRD